MMKLDVMLLTCWLPLRTLLSAQFICLAATVVSYRPHTSPWQLPVLGFLSFDMPLPCVHWLNADFSESCIHYDLCQLQHSPACMTYVILVNGCYNSQHCNNTMTSGKECTKSWRSETKIIRNYDDSQHDNTHNPFLLYNICSSDMVTELWLFYC
jgi:hypothetical protein